MARFSYQDESVSEETQQEICPLTVTQNKMQLQEDGKS
ncbi:Transcriptional regulator HxlR formaldehyde assimilation [Bacillus cereus]|nr:Transcriptional regulator HxlR formaldehyde assimilation [Bacillus cereus]